MSPCLVLTAAVFLAGLAATVEAGSGSPINSVCVAKHCAKQSATCFADKACRENLGCAAKCFGDWDKDKTAEKFSVQNCTGICTFSYSSNAYTTFMTCLAEKQCMTLPTIPNTCKGPSNITLLKEIPITQMEGAWWVVRGYHPVYDCYPCQNDHLSPHNSTAWVYSPHYQVYLANGSLGLIDQSGFVDTTTTNSAAGYKIAFEDAGISNYETWWIIDRADDRSYYLIYYCGNVLQWYFEGAIVLSEAPELPEKSVSAITDSYKKATGLDFSKFCSPRAGSGCPDQP